MPGTSSLKNLYLYSVEPTLWLKINGLQDDDLRVDTTIFECWEG